MKRTAITFVGLAVGLISLLGCGQPRPPVRVQYRGAILDNSLVIIVTNADAKPLFDVSISCSRWTRRYFLCSTLKPGESVEAGWMELPTGLHYGDTIQVYAQGYELPYAGTLPQY